MGSTKEILRNQYRSSIKETRDTKKNVSLRVSFVLSFRTLISFRCVKTFWYSCPKKRAKGVKNGRERRGISLSRLCPSGIDKRKRITRLNVVDTEIRGSRRSVRAKIRK